MKNALFLFLIAMASYKAEGKVEEGFIWIKPKPMPFKEFKANVKALGASHISYAQKQLRVSREQAQSFQLKEKLISAQELYLSGEEAKAQKAFQEISQKALLADWGEEERRIIIYAFLRQAQMEQRSEQRKALLLTAIEFALFKINKLDYPDYHLFPPPLLQEVQLLQTKANYLLVDWNKVFPQHEILLINGQRVEKKKDTKIPQALYRISAFSSSHQAWSENKSLSEMLTEKIKTKTLTVGFCEKTKIKTRNLRENTKLMPLSNCKNRSFLYTGKNIKPTKNLLSKNSSIAKRNSMESSSELLTSLELSEGLTKDLKKQNTFSEIPPWLIAGAGLVTFALILSLSQDKEVKKGDYVY